MWEARRELYAWLRDGAFVYVCGDVKAMAKDEYRFATLFGVCLGLLRACVTSMNERPRLPRGPLAITASRFATGGPR